VAYSKRPLKCVPPTTTAKARTRAASTASVATTMWQDAGLTLGENKAS